MLPGAPGLKATGLCVPRARASRSASPLEWGPQTGPTTQEARMSGELHGKHYLQISIHTLTLGEKKKREKGRGKKYHFQSKDVVRPKQPPLTHEPGCRDAVFSMRKGRILLPPLFNEEFILPLCRRGLSSIASSTCLFSTPWLFSCQ